MRLAGEPDWRSILVGHFNGAPWLYHRSASRRAGLKDRGETRVPAKLAHSQLNLDYPVWVEDDAFDLDRHLLRIGLSSPGG